MGPKPKTRHASGTKMSDLLGPGKEFSLSDWRKNGTRETDTERKSPRT